MKTYVPKAGEIEQKWVVIDAEGQVLGRVAAEAAKLLRGKHKPQFTPHMDCGDRVIIINAKKAKVTGAKVTDKMYYTHSGYFGSLTETSYGIMLEKHPTRAMMLAVRGMLPHNRLGRRLATHIRIYEGSMPEHGHQAQNPQPYALAK